MASALESAVSDLFTNDCVSVAIITAILYDYILAFPKEIRFIWCKPWSSVSTLYVLLRYAGICAFVTLAISGNNFLPGPPKVSNAINNISLWMITIFICATDLAMTLRVWAMYNRSRIILGALLVTYIGEVIPSVIACIVFSNPATTSVTIVPIANFSVCSVEITTFPWSKVTTATQLAHAGALCTLAIIQSIRELFQMRKFAKQWRLNRFMNLLVMQGIQYFLSMLTWNIINTMYTWDAFTSPQGWQIIFVPLVEIIPVATLTPRFMLSLREMYASSVRVGRPDGGIDTGFGLSALTQGPAASRSAIVFGEAEREYQDDVFGSEHGEEGIVMEEVE